MQYQQENSIPTFHFQSLAPGSGVRQAIFTRQGGVSEGAFSSLNMSVSVPDVKEAVYVNRRRAYGLFDRDTGTVVHAHLVHGADVARVSSQNQGTWVEHVDGIVTNEPGCALSMSFADCGSVFLYDPAQKAIGLGHAGWKGAIRNLPGALVRAMEAQFGSRPDQLVAALGPSIGPCCYEVGEPVVSQVRETFAAPDSLLIMPKDRLASERRNGRLHFNLPEANRRNLYRAGVRQIEMSSLCTACRTDLFFSHRAEKGKTGRFGTFFMLD